MVVDEIPFVIDSEDFSEAAGLRSPGLHVSKIIGELNEARGNKYAPAEDWTKQLYFSMGFLWEQFLGWMMRETAAKRRSGDLVRPGELVMDGIILSPDALDLSDYTLEEYKATYLGAKNDIQSEKFWHWIVQIKAYCRALATRRARLRVLFVVGEWNGSGPIVKCFQFEFTDREIEENWAMILNHARSRGYL